MADARRRLVGRPHFILSGFALLSIFSIYITHGGYPNWTYTPPPPPTILVLTAAHLGSDRSVRLRIIAHNLRMVMLQEGIKSILILSHDGPRADALALVDQWLASDDKNLVMDVIWVENDAIKVDMGKWMVPLHIVAQQLASKEWQRVILINDSFLLIRKVPELLENRGDVLGLVWTDPPHKPSRHLQSYCRSLSASGALAFMSYYDKESASATSVHAVIVKFELGLGWAPTGAQALYEAVAGGHPDNDDAQKELLPKGYPAIKLKKYHEPPLDPWMEQDKAHRSKVPSSFSVEVYRKANHDLGYLSDEQLRNHFAEDGWKEGRVYSSIPRRIKGWLKAFLIKQGANSSLAILEEHLKTAVNARARPPTSPPQR